MFWPIFRLSFFLAPPFLVCQKVIVGSFAIPSAVSFSGFIRFMVRTTSPVLLFRVMGSEVERL
ncbi:MAG: hypothetical protein ACI9YB_001457 [Halioglobus sp.]